MARKKSVKNSNLFVAFWNGDVSLVKSYWLIGVLLTIGVVFVATFLVIAAGLQFEAMFGIYIPWVIYITVGIWRSADKYKGPKYWAILAKIAMVIGVLLNFKDLLTGNY